MNIFALDTNIKLAAQMHLDKHIVKMPIEYAQLLSTAHRLHDGHFEEHITPQGRRKKFWLLEGEKVIPGEWNGEPRLTIENPVCYGLSHQNHPCAIWCRETIDNYNWLFDLLQETSAEYAHRYGRIHKTWSDVKDFLAAPPKKLKATGLTQLPQAMGEEFKVKDDPIQAYRNYYLGPKAAFAKWTNRTTPDWFKAGTKDFNVSNFERTNQLA